MKLKNTIKAIGIAGIVMGGPQTNAQNNHTGAETLTTLSQTPEHHKHQQKMQAFVNQQNQGKVASEVFSSTAENNYDYSDISTDREHPRNIDNFVYLGKTSNTVYGNNIPIEIYKNPNNDELVFVLMEGYGPIDTGTEEDDRDYVSTIVGHSNIDPNGLGVFRNVVTRTGMDASIHPGRLAMSVQVTQDGQYLLGIDYLASDDNTGSDENTIAGITGIEREEGAWITTDEPMASVDEAKALEDAGILGRSENGSHTATPIEIGNDQNPEGGNTITIQNIKNYIESYISQTLGKNVTVSGFYDTPGLKTNILTAAEANKTLDQSSYPLNSGIGPGERIYYTIDGIAGTLDGVVQTAANLSTNDIDISKLSDEISIHCANNTLTLHNDGNEKYTSIQIVDMAGRLVDKKQIQTGQNTFSIYIPKGIYIAFLRNIKGEIVPKKFISQ